MKDADGRMMASRHGSGERSYFEVIGKETDNLVRCECFN